MTEVVERLKSRANQFGKLMGNCLFYSEGDAFLDREAAYTIESLVAVGKGRFRHKKRGTEYEKIAVGKMQAERWAEHDKRWPFASKGSVDMREVAIYRSVDDGSYWVRPREEFEDGRFEPIYASTRTLPAVSTTNDEKSEPAIPIEERLRSDFVDRALCLEAAGEIERLRETAAFHESNWRNERDLKLALIERDRNSSEEVKRLREALRDAAVLLPGNSDAFAKACAALRGKL